MSSLPFAASLNVSKESIALGWCVCAWVHRGGGMERCGELNGFGRPRRLFVVDLFWADGGFRVGRGGRGLVGRRKRRRAVRV